MARVVQVLFGLSLLTVRLAHAQYIISVDLLSPGEPDYSDLPAGVVCVDIFADWPNTDVWTAGAIRGLTSGGARLRYAYIDPNDPELPAIFNPGVANRYSTCFSRPRGRSGTARFTNAGAAAAGAFNPPGATPIATSAEINVAYFASPPETNGPVFNGYVGRIALDVSAVPGAPTSIDDWRTGRLEDAPLDATFVFRSEPPTGGLDYPGTVNATFDHPEPYGINWGVWFVPEPSAVLLLLAGAGLARCIRRPG